MMPAPTTTTRILSAAADVKNIRSYKEIRHVVSVDRYQMKVIKIRVGRQGQLVSRAGHNFRFCPLKSPLSADLLINGTRLLLNL
jgi:hypothetical protein